MIDSNCIITRDFVPLIFAKIVLVPKQNFINFIQMKKNFIHYTITNSYFDSFIIRRII